MSTTAAGEAGGGARAGRRGLARLKVPSEAGGGAGEPPSGRKSPRMNHFGLVPHIAAPVCDPHDEAEVLQALTASCSVDRHERVALKRIQEARKRHDAAQSALGARQRRVARLEALLAEARAAAERAGEEEREGKERIAAIRAETDDLRARARRAADDTARRGKRAAKALKAYEGAEKGLHEAARELASDKRAVTRERRHLEEERNSLAKERRVLAETRATFERVDKGSRRQLKQLLLQLDSSIDHVKREVGGAESRRGAAAAGELQVVPAVEPVSPPADDDDEEEDDDDAAAAATEEADDEPVPGAVAPGDAEGGADEAGVPGTAGVAGDENDDGDGEDDEAAAEKAGNGEAAAPGAVEEGAAAAAAAPAPGETEPVPVAAAADDDDEEASEADAPGEAGAPPSLPTSPLPQEGATAAAGDE